MNFLKSYFLNSKSLLYFVLIASAVATRLFPHAWNFAPVTAVAIVAAVYLPLRMAITLPLSIRFVSDMFLGFFGFKLMIAVYLAHLFGVLAGLWVKRNKSSYRVLAAPAASAIVFFLVTNFAFLYPPSAYTHNLSGVISAYINGLPFLRGTLLGDIVYTVALIYGYQAILYFQKNYKLAEIKKI